MRAKPLRGHVMIGQTLGHYRILGQVGAGGMGVVYRGRDERLERDVALKVLPTNALADEEARKRFRKEALALSKLNHPNIATVFDFDHQNGVDFLAMEFIAGESLAEKLQHGALSEKEIAALGGQVASALEEAHDHGVIHRDLKPGNVMVTPKGHVKVLDFGLAKLLRPGGDADVTRSVTETKGVAGTLPYMAPEQLRNAALDARTDLHALGAVLYEMATGKRVFAEQSTPQLTDAILHRPPVSARVLNPRISPDLDRIILKCLEKDPENRYQSAKEIAVDVRRIALPGTSVSVQSPARPKRGIRAIGFAGTAALVLVLASLVALDVGDLRERLLGRSQSPIHSLAVLPLENLSRNPDQEYFADGMTEALIAELSRIRALKVISRTSVMQFKGAKKPLPEVARALNVDAIVEGSVLREGNDVRITVQLIDARSDAHLWAESYVRELKAILSLQGEVARAIAQQIRVTVTPEEAAHLSHRREVDPEAHALTLRGRQILAQAGTTPEGIARSIQLFQQAIQRDPQSAPAYAALATALIAKSGAGYAPMLEIAPVALATAEKAVSLDPTIGEALASRANAKFTGQWDWAGADRDFLAALELSPNSASVLDNYAEFLLAMKRPEESLVAGQRAVEADPLATSTAVRQAQRLLQAGRPDEAFGAIRKVLTLSPDDVFAKWILGVILSEEKQYDEAISVFLSRKVPSPGTNWALGYTYARAGKKAEARRIIDFLVKRRKEHYLWPAIIAHIYVALGEKDKAFEYLEQGFREHDYWLRLLQVDRRLDPLRSDPRFQDLLRRMNFPQN